MELQIYNLDRERKNKNNEHNNLSIFVFDGIVFFINIKININK
jgi:hypothetical protein